MGFALLLLDYQEGICRADGPLGKGGGQGPECERRGVLDAGARCRDAARAADAAAIVHSRVVFDAAGTLATNRSPVFQSIVPVLTDESGHAGYCPEIAPASDEISLDRSWVDPFVGTPLDGLLRSRDVNRLFVGGVITDGAVESAVRHAADLGYEVYLVDEMCASTSMEAHESAVERLAVFAVTVSEGDLGQLLG